MTMTVKHYDGINSRLDYIEDGKLYKMIYGVYAETADITFIMMEFYRKEKLVLKKVVGFLQGNEVENLHLIEESVGKLKAEFEGGL